MVPGSSPPKTILIPRAVPPPEPSAPADPRRRRHLLMAAGVALALIAALVLPPLINISRYQHRIAASLSASLGHTVEISGVRLQLLPRPRVQIDNFTVDSTAGYSAEPMLQCSSVTAAFRMMSLWRGHLEIARISLDEPSLNLERAPDGQWNFASVLVQASRTPQAPTGKRIAGQRRFPYIEASNARINFKRGNEKLPFSFLNADVSIWLENPNEWQLRFAAQPMRTDINLSLADTGQVRISGSVHRASNANQLPLDLQAEWRGAPLGQVSRMLAAHDLGWRGDVGLNARITGVPNALAFRIVAEAADFHRESFEPARPLNLHVTCTATYHRAVDSIDSIQCLSPIGSGHLGLSGTLQQVHTQNPLPDLQLVANGVPAGATLDLLRHTRGRLNDDVTISGAIDGQLAYARRLFSGAPHTVASGSLTATDLLVRGSNHGDNLEQILPDLHFIVQSPPSNSFQPTALVLQPTNLDLGGPEPLVANARLTRESYQLHYAGSGLVEHLLPLAHAFNVAPTALLGLQGDGTADFNLTVRGDWILPLNASLAEPDQTAGFSVVTGAVGLHNANFQPSYLAEPIHIATATATISPTELRWNGVTAALGTTHFSGNLHFPLPCRTICERHFDLTAANINLGAMAASLRGEDESMMQELISRVRAHSQEWPLLDGTLRIARLGAGQLELSGVSAELTLRDGKLEVRAFDGRTLGGTLHATGAVDLTSTPNYDTEVQLTHVSATELAQLLKERWGPGTLNISTDLTLSGKNASDLSSSANGMLQWEWNNGALPQLTSTPLHRFERWSGNGTVTKGAIAINSSEVANGSATSIVTGTIDRDRSLNLKIANPPPAGAPETETASTTPVTMTGTLAAPIVETQ